MSLTDGLSAVNLEMPSRVPRVEFDAETHWDLVKIVTAIDVSFESSDEIKQKAMASFVKAWNYDIRLTHNLGLDTLKAKHSSMGHSEYAAGGIDLSREVFCPFNNVEEVFELDIFETYGNRNHSNLINYFNDHYKTECLKYPTCVNTTGTYVTLFSGFIDMLGWDMFLTAAGTDSTRLGEQFNSYAKWMQQYYNALAECDSDIIYSHDDIVWTSGAVLPPEWYRKYVFPNYKKLYAPALEAGKKVLFLSDGNYTEFIDDIANTGVSGFFFEPLTDLKYIVEHYGQTHIIIGNVDTRILLLAKSKEEIKNEVKRCIDLGKNCPGYFIGVTNMIPSNTPVENALYYNQVYEELSKR